MKSIQIILILFINVILLLLAVNSLRNISVFNSESEIPVLFSKDSIVISNDNECSSPISTKKVEEQRQIVPKELFSVQNTPPVKKTVPTVNNTIPTTELPQEILEFDVMVSSENKGRCDTCFAYIKGKKIKFSDIMNLPKVTTNPSISIISTCTAERLDFIPFFLKRWPSYMVLAVQVKLHDQKMIQSKIISLNLPDRITIVILPVSNTCNKFYVNRLRNIAIRSIQTSHFLVLDMDLWPINNLYQEIMSLPSSIFQSDSTAVILPAFFLQAEPILNNCTTLMDCALKSEALFPKNKDELYNCVQSKQCTIRKLKGIQHLYVSLNWFKVSEHYAKMECFRNRFQEPYLMLKYSEDMLLFDERFVDYGCNKVQYVDHLRLRGYEFYILTQTFAMDLVHHDSSFRKGYMVYARAGLANNMRKLCDKYLAKTAYLYPNSTRVGICENYGLRMIFPVSQFHVC